MPELTLNDQLIQNAIMMRGDLMRSLIDRNGKDINKECGYPEVITPTYCKEFYDREGIAKRVVRIFPEETWKERPEILEVDDEKDTEFETAWAAVEKKLSLFSYLQRADIMSGIGTFGIILLGIDDGKQLIEPVSGVPLDGSMPKTYPKAATKNAQGDGRKRQHTLNYIRVFDESAVTINKFEIDITSPRYGQPLLYNVNFIQYGVNTQVVQPVAPMPTSPTPVHWTRVIHIADNRESSEVYGVPRMAPVVNRLVDLRKVLGGSGEMFWKGGFPGISFEVNPELQGVANLDTEGMRKEFENYQNGLQRYLALVGVTAKSLTVQLADPSNHFTTHIKAIACSLGIPWRILIGTEEAKLAADQDASAWNDRIANRQVEYVTPFIITPFINRLITMGILPPLQDMDQGLTVRWADLHTPSDTEKAEIADTYADAMNKYLTGGGDILIPPKFFLTLFMNMDDEQAEAVLAEGKKYLSQTGGVADQLRPPTTQPTPAGGQPVPNAGKGGAKDTQIGNFPNGGDPKLQAKAQAGGKAASGAPSLKPGVQAASPAAPSLKKAGATPATKKAGAKPPADEKKPVKNDEVPQRFRGHETAFLAGIDAIRNNRGTSIPKAFVLTVHDRRAFRAGTRHR